VRNHDVRLSDVGLDNGRYSFDRRPDRCHRETSQKMKISERFVRTLDVNPVGERGSKRRGGEIHEDNDQVAALGGNDGDSCCGVCSIAKDDMHAHRQRSEDLLLPTAEEREVVMQAGEEGSR
jgi:hypothetical protein